MGGPIFWGSVYLGVAGAALLRRWRQARPSYGLGEAGWEENPQERPGYRARALVLRLACFPLRVCSWGVEALSAFGEACCVVIDALGAVAESIDDLFD